VSEHSRQLDQQTAGGNGEPTSGDAKPTIAALYQAHYLAVFALARGITLDDRLAEAVTQAAFRKARRRSGRESRPAPDQAWLCALATRLAIARVRRRALRRMPGWPIRLVQRLRGRRGVNPDDPEFVLERMRPRWRAAVVLRFVHGYAWSDIPAIVGLRSQADLGELTGMSCPMGLPERAESAWIGPTPLPELAKWLRTPSDLERQMRTLRRVTVGVVLALALAVTLIRLAVILGPGLGI
jgi:DNA-directed RNA polymerase specialized sigma24 family protein